MFELLKVYMEASSSHHLYPFDSSFKNILHWWWGQMNTLSSMLNSIRKSIGRLDYSEFHFWFEKLWSKCL